MELEILVFVHVDITCHGFAYHHFNSAKEIQIIVMRTYRHLGNETFARRAQNSDCSICCCYLHQLHSCTSFSHLMSHFLSMHITQDHRELGLVILMRNCVIGTLWLATTDSSYLLPLQRHEIPLNLGLNGFAAKYKNLCEERNNNGFEAKVQLKN